MIHALRQGYAFSIVELTIALGIASFCLIAIFSLVPIGLKANQSSTSETAAASILSAVIADMRATPKASASSTQYAIRFGSSKTLYFDSAGKFSPDLASNSRYQMTIMFLPNAEAPTAAVFAHLKLTWPAAATAASAQGTAEMFAAFDRH